MDADNVIPVTGNGPDSDDGLRQLLPASEQVNGMSNGGLEVEQLGENLEENVKLNVPTASDSPTEIADQSGLPSETHLATEAKETGVEESGDSKNLKPVKVKAKPKNGATGLSKSKDGKELPKSSNGTTVLESRPRQSYAVKSQSKSFNEKQASSKPKSTSSLSNNSNTKLPRDSDGISSSTSGAHSEELPEKTKLKTLKKGPVSKGGDISPSSQSPTSGDAKPRKLGTLPAYSFSFKCDERAEKRREFYSKLEEKIHAKEVEKNNLQAMTKETQEAEIKMLRKSLGFKATPMPSFYQEPAPPKVELKKIPTTRAKSPKLGRKKSPPSADSKENGANAPRPARLSLDEKVSHTNIAKAPHAAHLKKPLRKSLPKLPSENTTLSQEKKKPSSRRTSTTNAKDTSEPVIQHNSLTNELNEAASETQKPEAEAVAEPINVEILPEAQQETPSVQEPIAV